MVRFFDNICVFELPWISVTNAWINKYPNQHSLQVCQVDTISRSFDEESGEFVIRRLVSSYSPAPKWMSLIGFPSHAYILEEARINPFKKKLTLKGVNCTGNEFLEVEEICTYSETSDENGTPHTSYRQKAIIESPIPYVTSACEAGALVIYESHAEKGMIAMKQLCSKVANLGHEGLLNVLQMRLDCVLLLQDLSDIHKLDKSVMFPRKSS